MSLISIYRFYLSTRANHPLKFMHIQVHINARTNRSRNSFLPQTAKDWNSLEVEDMDNIDLETFKNYLNCNVDYRYIQIGFASVFANQ